MSHFVKVEQECDHEDCNDFHAESKNEASRDICCEGDGDDCKPDVYLCMRKPQYYLKIEKECNHEECEMVFHIDDLTEAIHDRRSGLIDGIVFACNKRAQ